MSQPARTDDLFRLMQDAIRPAESDAESTADFGRYRLVEHVGEGGMGSVWKGWDTELRRWVALKFIKDSASPESLTRLRREARLAAGLDHPNIAKIYELAERPHPFIAMQFIEGKTLDVAARKMNLEQKVRSLRQVAEALRYAHGKGVIHRDLKPSNVMVDIQGGTFLMDLGVAKQFSESEAAATGTLVGTPVYMAPEQARGKADSRSDLYGWGAMLYELTTGRPPFDGASVADVLTRVLAEEPMEPRRINPTLPKDLEAITLKCLEKEPARRYAGARPLIEDLDAYLGGNPLRHARPTTRWYVLRRKIRKHPLPWTLGAALAISLISGAIFGLSGLVKAKRSAEERARVERKGREETERETRKAKERLAYNFLLRARNAYGWTDRSRAAVYSAAAYDEAPSRITGICASAALEDAAGLDLAMEAGRPITAVAISPDDSTVASIDADGEVRLWDLSTGTLRCVLPSSQPIYAVGIRDAGRTVIGVGRTAIAFWKDGTPDGEPISLDAYCGVAAFDTECGYAALRLPDGKVGIWNLALRQREALLDVGGTLTDPVAIDRSGRILATAGQQWEVRVWEGKRLLWSFAHPQVASLAISPDAHYLLTGGGDHYFRAWDLNSGRESGTLGFAGPIMEIRMSRGGDEFLIGTWNGLFYLWSFRWGDQAQAGILHDRGRCATLNSNGDRFVTAGTDGTIRLWHRPRSRQEVVRIAPQPKGSGAVLCPNRRKIVFLAREGTAEVVDMDSGLADGEKRNLSLPVFPRFLTGCEDDSRMAAWDGATLRVWKIDPLDATPEWTVPLDSMSFAALSPSGTRIAVAVPNGSVRTWDLRSGRELDPIPISAGYLAFGRGDRLLMKTSEGELHLKNPDQAAIRIPTRSTAPPYFSPDGSVLAVLDESLQVRIHSTLDGSILRTLEGRVLGASLLIFSPDGRSLAAPETEFRIGIWDVATGLRTGGAIGENIRFSTYRFSADGQWIATVARENHVDVWHVPTGLAVGRRLHLPFTARFVGFSGDGKRLSAVGAGGELVTWDVSYLQDNPPSPEVCSLRARAYTGLHVGPQGEIESLPPEEWRRLRAQAERE